MDWSKRFTSEILAPIAVEILFYYCEYKKFNRLLHSFAMTKKIVAKSGYQRVKNDKRNAPQNKKAEKTFVSSAPVNPNQINYEKNYLGSNMLIGIMTSSNEIPPC